MLPSNERRVFPLPHHPLSDWHSTDPVNPAVRSVFDRNAFLLDKFMPAKHEGDHELTAIGRMLFFRSGAFIQQ